MKAILIFAAIWVNSQASKKAIEGFLSGFQDTEVYVKSECLSNETMAIFHSIFQRLGADDSSSKAIAIYNLVVSIKSQIAACHFLELFEIIGFLRSLTLEDVVLHSILNLPRIIDEAKEVNKATDEFQAFKLLGKIMRVWVDEANHLTPGVGSFLYGFLEQITINTEQCTTSCIKIKESLDDIGNKNYGSIKASLSNLYNSYTNFEASCDYTDFKQKLIRAVGVQGYINIGMNLEKIKATFSMICLSLINQNFENAGEELYSLILIIVS